VAPAGDRFDEDRVGLDHLSLLVDTASDLHDAVRLLDDLGIAHEPIKDIGDALVLEFRDPDNVALEVTAPKA